MSTKDLTHEAIARALTNGDVLTHEQRSVLLGLVADDKMWQRKHDRLLQALQDIADPIAAWRRDLKEGERLDGQAALYMASKAETYQRMAREALMSPMSYGECIFKLASLVSND